MGLEAATYLNQLVNSNPLAADKKNQGDDHLRLIKAVLQNTFPNADRPFRFPEALTKNANYTAADPGDENRLVLCDATAGSFTITLPAPMAIDGWTITIVKSDAGGNPVYVAPASGTVNGLAKIRINVPYIEHRFIWTGSTYIRMNPPGYRAGLIEPYAQNTVPVGHAQATGQSLLRADHPELFAEWGTTYGAVDGTHFNAPDLQDRFIIGVGFTNALGVAGGEATHVLTQAEMPSHSHGTTEIAHNHDILEPLSKTVQFSGFSGAGGQAWFGNPGSGTTTGSRSTNLTINNTGGGAAHENRPPYRALWLGFRLC